MIVSGFIWQSQRIGYVLSGADDLKANIFAAIGRLGDGQAALAEGDFTGGSQAFQDAQTLIHQTQTQVDEALLASRYILSVVDITGTLRAGQNLLHATDRLSEIGVRLSAIAEKFSEEGSLTDAISGSRGSLEVVAAQLSEVEVLLSDVPNSLIPEEARDKFTQLQTVLPSIRELVDDTVAQSDVILALLGAHQDRTYLVLLANNHELRPVGGFIGTVAVAHVDSGEVESIDVSSVYEGDGQIKQAIAPPSPLLPIVSQWYLRDSNWFVDFPVSARKASELFEKQGGSTVDGVILLTPQVITRILQVTGPITVPGYDQIVTAENFVAVTQDEVTYNYDESLNKPKQFLADLTPLILERIFNQSEKKLETLSAMSAALTHKEMVLYFRDTDAQQQIERFNWAGKIPKEVPGMLHVNNANIGGHKSDQFIEQEIDQRIQVLSDGTADITVTIRRTHKGPSEGAGRIYPDGENPAQKDNVVYQRVLVPQGAQLVEAKGFTPTSHVPVYQENNDIESLVADADIAAWQGGQVTDASGTNLGVEAGYPFFGNWIITKPGQTSVALYRYTIPDAVTMPGIFNKASQISTAYTHQAGQDRTSLRVEMMLPAGYRIIQALPDSGVTREADSSAIYRTNQTKDQTFGVVFEQK